MMPLPLRFLSGEDKENLAAGYKAIVRSHRELEMKAYHLNRAKFAAEMKRISGGQINYQLIKKGTMKSYDLYSNVPTTNQTYW
jgi:hypothetical protein